MTTTPDASFHSEMQTQLLGLRESLLRHVQSREGEASRVQHAHEVLTQDVDDAQAHDADREVDLALSDQDRQHLQDIQAALERLEACTYGDCKDCGEVIAPERLRVQPQALRCMACATRYESRHGTQPRVTL